MRRPWLSQAIAAFAGFSLAGHLGSSGAGGVAGIGAAGGAGAGAGAATSRLCGWAALCALLRLNSGGRRLRGQHLHPAESRGQKRQRRIDANPCEDESETGELCEIGAPILY